MTLLPVVVLTGFLGSGKTTVLNHWLSRRDDLAVIINELGQVGIDQALVGETSVPVSLLAGGCVCCTVQGSLRTTLRNLFMARAAGDVPRFSTVLVETTGAADPFGVTSVLEQDPWLRRHFQLRSVITTVDARSGMAGLSRHPEVIEQVRAADVLLLTKADQVEAEQRGPLEAALAELNPGAERRWSEQGRVEPTLLNRGFPRRCRVTGQLSAVADPAVPPLAAASLASRHRFHAADLRWRGAVDYFALQSLWADLLEQCGPHLVRLKALVAVDKLDGPLLVQGVGGQPLEMSPLPSWPGDDDDSRLVLITDGDDPAFPGQCLAAFRTALDRIRH
ncbi:Cobalamin synthesis protein/P47K family protein [Alloalcanivorax dieselolei B5]|uniref:Cobalamin synthesis protein/P47K family protein n=1 Tax=Alcanivorax dieselolei (strain DSM 16502 / CGMCC 1.3690 / MCCC 1A00001 / B-5) TaxID=930169 RepID=K0CHZ2_ALCDB|nr:GTP-binding protein [Alloalcanivorax dieselolei]AFT71292.1 Cobalamin synthesis protein/P47K family protein [Alloalcanivorax dieselolei B5]GGJ94570.1 cobalamin biosynthesis protein CobW [Alloalcanivorax dieselolei]